MEPSKHTLEELARYAASIEMASPPAPTPETKQTDINLMQQMSTQFAQALTKVTQQFIAASTTKQHTAFRQTFAGLEQEDPAWFLDQADIYFEKIGQLDDVDKIGIVDGQLRGEAKRWHEPFRGNRETYENFRTRFETYFSSSQKITQAATKLYGETQRIQDSVAGFIMKKQALFQRLAPSTSDEYRAGLIINQLIPELRSRLRGIKITTLEELIHITTQIEADLADIKTERKERAPPTVRESAPREGREIEPRKPPTPCRYCQQWHYNNQCPSNPFLGEARPSTSGPPRSTLPQNRADERATAAPTGPPA